MTEPRRIEELEEAVSRLARELEAVRLEVARLRAPPGAPSPAPKRPPAATAAATGTAPRAARSEPPREAFRPPAPRPRAAAPVPREELDVETLVGRYGAVGVAALTILMGVGAFVRWAVEHVRLGPELRVLLGALGALAVAAGGVWLRRRGHRRYGSIVLALALAITHVVAWGAGPQLGVVPPAVALGAAALASAALALLAWRAGEELLFVVGVGGAFLAPFVTSSGRGSALVLLGFGFLVFVGGAAALHGRRWAVANLVLAVAVASYAGAAFAAQGSDGGARALTPLLFALSCAWVAIALDEGTGLAWAVRGALGTAAILSLALADVQPVWMLRAAAVAGTLTAYVRRVRVAHDWSGLVVEGVAVPLLFLCAALASFSDPATPGGVGHALLWAAMASAVAAQAGPGRRDVHAFVAALCGGVALLLALPDRLELLAPALAAYGLFLVAVAGRLGAALLTLPALLAFALATSQAGRLLAARPDFGYTPFATLPSLVSAGVLVLWVAAGFVARRAAARLEGGGPVPLASGPHFWWTAATVLGVLWGREELAGAFSPDVANFLLIAYYAVTGVALIAVGRAEGLAAARRAGLALAVYADLKAIFTAAQISAIGLRVGSYLLSGFFLLAVGYWAWAGGRDEAERTPGGGDAPDVAPTGSD